MFTPQLLRQTETIIALLSERSETLAVAESCTGGLLAGLITEIAGASKVFSGGIVSYANAAKEALLSVSADDLQRFGAVSEPVALAMVQGAAERLQTDWALSTTGVAGPGGGTAEKPVGRVYIGIFKAGGSLHQPRAFDFAGDRRAVRLATLGEALNMLEHYLRLD